MSDRNLIRRLIVLVAGIAVFAILTACVPLPPGGQTKEAAVHRLRQLDGILEADVYVWGTNNWFFGPYVTVVVSVTLDDGYSVSDSKRSVNFLAEFAWSVNKLKPKQAIDISIYGPDNEAIKWAEVATEPDWHVSTQNRPESATMYGRIAEDRLGRWPGDIPARPTDLLVRTDTGPVVGAAFVAADQSDGAR